MRYSTYNAIPQYPKSKKHPYETLEKPALFRAFAGVDFSCGKQALFSQNIPQKWTAVWKVRPGLWACLALLLWAAQYSIPA